MGALGFGTRGFIVDGSEKARATGLIGRLIGHLHRLKTWVESQAGRPHAMITLFLIAFIESSFFPVPPDVLLIAMAVLVPRRAFLYALICTAGSVSGAFLGYYIGYAFFEGIAQPILEFYHAMDKFQVVLDKYRENAFWSILVAGFTPIPYKVFTIAAGFKSAVPIPTLFFASVIGRGARFSLVAGLISVFGPSIKTFIDRYFDLLSIVFLILLVLGFFAISWIM